jgi:hypothetical protein
MADQNALPKLDLSTSIPVDSAIPSGSGSASAALPKLDMSTSIPVDAPIPSADSSASDTGVWAGVKRNTVGMVAGLYHAFTDPATDDEKAAIARKIADYNSRTKALDPKSPLHMDTSAAANPSPIVLARHRLLDAPADQLNAKATDEFAAAKELYNQGEYWKGAGVGMSGAMDKLLSVVPMLGPYLNSVAERAEKGDVPGAMVDMGAALAMERGLAKVTGQPAATPGFAGKATEAIAKPVGETLGRATGKLVNPFRRAVTTPFASPEEVGEAASQPIAKAGIQTAAPTIGPSLRSGIDVQTPFAESKALYQTVDNAAKTDFKALYEKLDAAQDAAREAGIGSPEEAKAQLNIKNTQDAIDAAKEVARQSGVADVDKTLAQADAKYAETQANKDLNSKFFGGSGVIEGNVAHGAPETINIGRAISVLENMDKPNKYGVSRLRMTSLGEDGAFKLKQYLYDAQNAGRKAMNARELRNTMLKWGIPSIGTVLGLGYGISKMGGE